ncbi:hypothetical protein ACIRF8_12630 [Streptomyces sp. NPDC102406]|uniref:hypothetical protein n=1 Tax=Streptomyces sp. NPDC102406 TaxID=3366171 RepID=UPI0037FB6A59
MSPLRTLRQIIAPTGRHRAPAAVLEQGPLLEETTPREPLLEETALEQLLAVGDIEPIECAPCPTCERTTFHAMHADGSRTCWTCRTTTPGE